ncbi:cytochrome c biogenesis protein ResB [Agreia pratensis]|uniref:cytochrome c biogenesis protein ResB n=1 Tax=Agreia pratensis TaxID=150121 RepID=UPI00188D5089|nr:cytochrome c biogenesis protein ResB [Agreia pratensis]MBF4632939.1 cytochrome c biogenesis protein ResB [Agreia pratensis]
MSRPSDHFDSPSPAPESARNGDSASITQPKLGVLGWLRWFWRQLSSMRTALFLLLLLALAAVPGSLVPQRSSDPNGVTQYFVDNPTLAPILDSVQMFSVYSSVWFSSIYLLLFISLVGCVIPRTKHHFDALRSAPPKTPARLERLGGFTTRQADGDSAAILESARSILKKSGYRVRMFQDARSTSVSAERGYARETGNLVFHTALVGILVTVGIGGGFGYAGQRVVVEGQTFVNTLLAFDSFNPGRFFSDDTLTPFTLRLDKFDATYETKNLNAFGQPIDYSAHVTTTEDGQESDGEVKVNSPLKIGGSDVYLLGNGYAPTLTVKNPQGDVVFTDSVPFLPQDANLTSLGVVKITDGLPKQVGMIGFFYPTQDVGPSGAFFSSFPEAEYPVVTLNVYEGDLGLDKGVPTSVYSLATDKMTQLNGGKTGVDSIELKPGETAQLPDGLGSVTLDGVKRFASFDIHRDPTQAWVLVFAILVLGGLLTSLFIPRRRVWVKLIENADGTGVTLEYAGLARGDDPRLDDAVAEIADKHIKSLPTSAGKTTTTNPGANTSDDA